MAGCSHVALGQFGFVGSACFFAIVNLASLLGRRLWLHGFGFSASASWFRFRSFGFAASAWRFHSKDSAFVCTDQPSQLQLIASALLLGLRLRLCNATFGFTASGSLFSSLWFFLRDFDFRASALQLWLHELGSASFRRRWFVCHCCCRCWRRLCWSSAS